MQQEKSPEDEAFEEIEMRQLNSSIITALEISEEKQRNDTLEEVAQEFDKMTALGDTAASFAAYVRGMKR